MTAKEMQARATAKRWGGMTAEEKSAEMSKVRKKGIKTRAKKRSVIRRPNAPITDHSPLTTQNHE